MLCHQCGSPVEAGDAKCPNCGAELKSTKRLELSGSRGLRISQELKAIRLEAQHFPPGEEVAGRFVLGEMIGKGPFGEVYRATDSEIDADVAVKIFDAEVLRTPHDEENFLNATRAARTMTQPNLVRLHDSGVHKGHPWVSMQHLEGLTLRKVLDLRRSKNETFKLSELEPIVSQVTLALQHVSREFPHGDLKPENIVFLPDLLKVTDAYILAALSSDVIIDRLKNGPYFAPELHNGATEPGARADVYSVGTIIGEMMFGPDYTPGSQADGEYAAIDVLVKRATAFDPSERYPSVEALSEDLSTLVDTGTLLGGGPGGKKPPPPPPSPGAGAGPPAPPPGPAPVSEAGLAEDQKATVEYDRDLDDELQDQILTEEVDRDQFPGPGGSRKPAPRASAGASKTAAAPQPRKVSEGPPWGIVAIVALGLLALAVGIGMSMRDHDVEQIGETPKKIEKEATKPSTEPEEPDETPEEPDESKDEVALAAASLQARTDRIAASTRALEVVKAEAPAEEPGDDEEDEGARKSTASSSSKGSPEKAHGSKKKAVATGTDCPGGMSLIKSKKLGNYCIDRFEFPGRGATPKTRVSWFQAKKTCASKGKRLCKLAEWRISCGGKYPYGRKWDADRCNTADVDGFERSIAKAGSFKRCRSRSGAYDMVGNVHEWVAEQRIAGGGFESGEDVASCRYSSPKSPASSAGYIGFRCCAQPE